MNSRHFCWVNSMKDRKKPAIRFKGFTEDWEQRKLGEVVDVCSGRDYKHLSEGDIPVYGTGGYMLSVNQALSYDEDAIGIGRKGTIDKPYVLKSPFWTVDTLFYAVPRDKIALNFAFDIFQNIDWKKKDESTGVPSLSKTAINEIDVLIPKYEEQHALGQFFNDIDNLITLHQRKYDKLVNVKKSMLEKMFPRDGKFVPDVRFSGFTEDWEQRKLGDVVGITSGFMGDSLLSDGKYHLTRIETIADGIVDENRVGYSNEKPDDMYLLKHGDILYSNINSISHMGKVAKYQGNSPLYHGINLLRLQPENNINSDFLLYLLNTEKCRNWAKTRANQAVSQASINQSLLTTQEIAISSFEEQKKIGDYFRNLDNLITLHQRKLEKLKNIKKSCLVKMFI